MLIPLIKKEEEEERFQITDLSFNLKMLVKEKQIKPKVGRRKEIIKITVEINAKENRKAVEKIHSTEGWFFEQINNCSD